MTDREVMQQALEALETCGEDEWHSEDDFGMVQTYDEDKVAKGVTALRTALEQQQAEPTCPECKAAVLYECVACSSNNYPPQQQQAEPVAYYHPQNGFYWAKPTSIFAPTVVDVPPIPLYTTAAKREWIGLTPEEVLDLFDVNNVYGSKWIEFARTVEAALRSKNT